MVGETFACLVPVGETFACLVPVGETLAVLVAVVVEASLTKRPARRKRTSRIN